jgi:hypothetical protein
VGQLDGWHGSLGLHEIQNGAKGFHLNVVPEAKVPVGDATLGRDRDSFREDQGGASGRKLSEVNHVPGIGEPVRCRVLAHGGDDESIPEGQAAQLDWGKQEWVCHG